MNPSPSSFSPGELGKCARLAFQDLQRLGWFPFLASHQKYSSLNSHHYGILKHPVIPYLHCLATHGVPAPSTATPWTFQQKQQAFQQGPHVSAAKIYASFVLEDMYQMVREGYWCVLPFAAVAAYPHLKLSPAGVVPQRERRPRIILDYSFPHDNNVNTSSLPIAPTHAMQFGTAFQCLMQHIVYCNPAFSPPLMAKLDLADGYYRVPLSPLAALELAVVLPGDGPYDRLIGIPLSLPMGWTHSPPYFCAFTETVTDIANASVYHPHLPRQPLESSLQTTPYQSPWTSHHRLSVPWDPRPYHHYPPRTSTCMILWLSPSHHIMKRL